MQEDPFERAARREALLLGMPSRLSNVWPLVGLQLAWAVFLGLHWWLAEGDGRLLAIHVTAFVVAAGFTAFATIASLARPRWSMFAIVAGWAPLLALHWVRADGRTPFLVANTIAFACALAVAVLALFSTPGPLEGGLPGLGGEPPRRSGR